MPTTQSQLSSQKQFDELFLRSRRRAYNLAYRMTGNTADAEDATQDAYVRAWRHFSNYKSDCAFEGWLFRILVNRVIDMKRRNQRVRMVSIDAPKSVDEGKPFTGELNDPDSDPYDILFLPTMSEPVQRAVSSLPQDYRTAILLCYVEQRSYKEIADATCCALGTVRSRIHRGRQMIRRSLAVSS